MNDVATADKTLKELDSCGICGRDIEQVGCMLVNPCRCGCRIIRRCFCLCETGNNAEQGITGTVDYFTLTEYDANIEAIQVALNNVENLSWAINSVQYEEDTNLIHYEWRWTLYG